MNLILVVNGGTTNLRVSALDAESKEILAVAKAEAGARHVAMDGGNQRLKTLFKECIDEVLQKTGCTTDDVVRCVAYGMITSNMGLYEIPHLIAPTSREQLRDGMKTASFPEIAPFDIEFIPGVRNFAGAVDDKNCSDMDMMRGEETEAVGLYQLMNLTGSALFVMPGSHNKIVRMDEQGRVLGCMTSISGELLDVLSHNTILSDAVNHEFASAETYDPQLAIAGARECAASGIGRAAFAGRILNTLGGMPASAVQSWLLGAVFMEDVRAMQTYVQGDMDVPVYVVGQAPIQTVICDVLREVGGMNATALDAYYDKMMPIQGVLSIAEIQ